LILAHRISAMQGAVQDLLPVLQSMQSHEQLPEADWSKLRRLDFQEALRNRDAYTTRVIKSEVHSSEDFEADVSHVRIR
jgi:antiviral helicase SKI2